ncbi:MAG: T9SS type A sorting domain-containing protein [Bacteroidota bacterium]|nr:T9SS type A sorting domain-containing protein [Bacteroidota bacterium]
MKQIILTSLLLFSVLVGYAQITLQKTYNYSTTVVKLETLGYKYYLMDVPASQVRIYNMDHSVFKTINCNVPSGYYLADVKYVSQNLFNTDSQIELVYIYYKYVTTATSYYYIYGSRIINENGSNLQTIDGAQYIFVNKTGDSEYKLFAYCFDYSIFPEKVWTNIYSLTGSLVSALNISGNQPNVFLNAYPNPATDVIRLAYELPANVKSASLNLIDSNGRAVKNFQVDGHSDHIAVNVNDLSAGIYHYFIEYDNRRTSSKKIIIN